MNEMRMMRMMMVMMWNTNDVAVEFEFEFEVGWRKNRRTKFISMERGNKRDEEEGRTGMCVVTGKKQGNCENSLLSHLLHFKKRTG